MRRADFNPRGASAPLPKSEAEASRGLKPAPRFRSLLVAGILIASCNAQSLQFPEWRVQQLVDLPSLWEMTPIAAVGDLENITEYGEQYLDHLPSPVQLGLHTLYWCQGEFRAIAVLKGSLPETRKYVFGSVNPGCRVYYGDPAYEKRSTRVWFLRRDGDWLRPTVDGENGYFLGLYAKWPAQSIRSPKEQLGLMLLDPKANAESDDDFARGVWSNAELACSLIGNTACVQKLKALAKRKSRTLRTEVCAYLKAEQNETCEK